MILIINDMFVVAIISYLLLGTTAFVLEWVPVTQSRTKLILFSNVDDNAFKAKLIGNRLCMTLPKPLGLILEANNNETVNSVSVKAISELGSVSNLSEDYTALVLGSKVAVVEGNNMISADFDSVMEAILQAPDILQIEFEVSKVKVYEIGKEVTIVVKSKEKPDFKIQAKVGDNLRAVLLENKVEVYKGFKQLLGNCGGAGQCTFCSFDFLESDGWEPRSQYENTKLTKNPNGRQTCLNNIQGPATIIKTQI